MPRPCKRRRICAMPKYADFGPLDSDDARTVIAMTVDEFEAIRLIDLEGLNQEECAARMDVARTTAQAIYLSARKKLAESLIGGRRLRVGGGQYVLCQGGAPCCGGRCRAGTPECPKKEHTIE